MVPSNVRARRKAFELSRLGNCTRIPFHLPYELGAIWAEQTRRFDVMQT